jgi:hypothetical protein
MREGDQLESDSISKHCYIVHTGDNGATSCEYLNGDRCYNPKHLEVQS